MRMRLIDRERELAALEAAARARGGQLVVVWGRRRTGKTYLLQAFIEHRRCVYYTATRQSAPIERPLKRLLTLGMLERRVPALDDPARTKRAIYRIVDPYFAFWFRFIASNRPYIARGLGAQIVDGRILPGLDDHMGGVFEEMAREHARGLAGAGDLEADRVAAWWSADGAHEIDLVGVAGSDRIGFIGTVTWSERRLGKRCSGQSGHPRRGAARRPPRHPPIGLRPPRLHIGH